jgi:hypothetical protein
MANPLKRLVKRFVDDCVVPAYVYVGLRKPGPNVLDELERRTAAECADYAQANMASSLQFAKKGDLQKFALGNAGNGLVCEFGVWKGESINRIAALVSPRPVYGFDSFEGLREDWAGWEKTKGDFDLKGVMPAVAPNVKLIKGWFDSTLPGFLAAYPGAFSFVNFDCDTYEACKSALQLVSPRIIPGTILVFDEYFGYRGWKLGEYKAWQECVRESGLEYEYIAFSLQAVAVRVSKRRE